MDVQIGEELGVSLEELRAAIQQEYAAVARSPQQGFHFHTGRPLAEMLGYLDAWLEGIPAASLNSFAGTGNPFSSDPLRPGEHVVDVGCGAGLDSLIAAATQRSNVEFHGGYAESLPVPDSWADVVISNGVLNLVPDKSAALAEMARVLKPGGRLQVADIVVGRPVPDSAKRNIDLWTG